MIEIADFTKRFGSFTAVENMNLTIKPGRIFGLLGPNGAGKSTTVKTMVGILKPTEGMILVNGKDITTEPEETKSIIGYVPENPIVFNKLTGIEYLTLVGDGFSSFCCQRSFYGKYGDNNPFHASCRKPRPAGVSYTGHRT